MKKILLASVAFAGFATAAAAEITLSGGGYVGVSDFGTGAYSYDSRFQLQFDGSIESDSGVAVSARVRLRSEETGVPVLTGPRINVTAGGLTVSMGNTDDAIRARSNPWASCLSEDICTSMYTGWAGSGSGFSNYGSGAVDRVRVDYAFGDHTVSVADDVGIVGGDDRTTVGYSGKFGTVGVNLGYRMPLGAAGADFSADVNGTFGTFNVGVRHEALNNSATTATTLYGNTTFGATTVAAFVGKASYNANAFWGVGATHDLGGGIAINGAFTGGAGMTNQSQLHLTFSF